MKTDAPYKPIANMKRNTRILALVALFVAPAFGQAPVVGAADPESLFMDADPVLHANKQTALHIMRELLQCNHWDEAGKWLTDRYVQHNPNVASGLAGVVKAFGSRPRAATCDKLTRPVVAVLADGDFVTVVVPREYDNPRKPGTQYTTTWFDMWRMVDGKADEHWDPATIAPPPQ
jgi:predicted SnoaL-like aldol condensation-catalyzing enzyme